MKTYRRIFDFREPYQVLLDAEAIKLASKFKVRLGPLLESTLHGTIKPMITQCCIRHLYNSPAATELEKKQKDAWIEVAKTAERRRCDHHELEEPLSALECLSSVVDASDSGANKHRYVVVTQEKEIREKMRSIAGVPIIFMRRSVMILEPMASKSAQVREREEKYKIRSGLKSGRGVTSIKRLREEQEVANAAEDGGDGPPPKKKSKVKGVKGPNPLSVKKPKSGSSRTTPKSTDGADGRPLIPDMSEQDLGDVPRQSGLDDPKVESQSTDGVTEGPRKRKRKRKHKEVDPTGLHEAVENVGGEE